MFWTHSILASISLGTLSRLLFSFTFRNHHFKAFNWSPIFVPTLDILVGHEEHINETLNFSKTFFYENLRFSLFSLPQWYYRVNYFLVKLRDIFLQINEISEDNDNYFCEALFQKEEEEVINFITKNWLFSNVDLARY